jgi:hypothetical protein
VLLQAVPSEIEEHVRIAQGCFREAGMEIVGYPMSSDSYIFSDRFEDDDGEEGWKSILKLLTRVEENQTGVL